MESMPFREDMLRGSMRPKAPCQSPQILRQAKQEPEDSSPTSSTGAAATAAGAATAGAAAGSTTAW